MSYEKMTLEKWMKNLLAGKFENAASAKKSIAKTSWPDRTKQKARQAAEQHFEKPGSVKLADVVRKSPGEEQVEVLQREPAAIPVRQTSDMVTAKLLGIQHIIRGCREALETMKIAHDLYPEADMSNGMIVVEKLLNRAITDLANQSEMVLTPLAPKGNGKAVEEAAGPSAPPIVPNFTPEQKELFDKTKPKAPFTPPQIPKTS